MNSSSRQKNSTAFTLIELIGVLAIIAILAIGFLSTTTRQVDITVAGQERTNLVSYATALQNSILRNKYIPGTNDWASVIATELGVSTTSVTTNARNYNRYYLIDPALQIGTNTAGTLPYSQANNLLAMTTNNYYLAAPTSPRLLLVTTLGNALPSFVSNGIASTTVFSNLWNWNDTSHTPPAGFPATWDNYADDLQVQRVNLAPLFVHFIAQNYPTTTTNLGQFVVDSGRTNTVPNSPSNGANIYVLQTSLFSLLKDSGSGSANQANQIINRDSNFYYIQQVWRGGLSYGTSYTSNTTAAAMASVFEATTAAFRASPYNNHATSNTTPPVVIAAMSNFLGAYISYANAGFPSTGTLYTAADAAQTTVKSAMANIFSGITSGGCTNAP
jgi:type II secretory pathway pseudopilin PulG